MLHEFYVTPDSRWLNQMIDMIQFYASKRETLRKNDEGYCFRLLMPDGLIPHYDHETLIQQNLIANYKKLFSARCLLESSYSRMVFDDAILVRILGPWKYFVRPPEDQTNLYTSDSLDIPIPHSLPTSLMGMQLSVHRLKLDPSRFHSQDLYMYSSTEVVDYISYWKPYLVKFDTSASFWPSLGDTVFDCGACIGENSLLFASLVGSSGSVHAFDPTPVHQDVLQFQISLNSSRGLNLAVHPIPYAVGANTMDVTIDIPSNPMSSINPGPLTLNKFRMVSLDDYSTAHSVIPSYIKMDIEGFEIDALKGASQTISANRPTLAISGYHKLEHLWEIPPLIKKLSDKYCIYLAHHSPTTWETVFYADSI